MASYDAMLRCSDLARATETVAEHARTTQKNLSRFARPQAFACPPAAKGAAIHAVRNVGYFRMHYALVLWILLLATLIPARHASMLFLMATSKVIFLYGALLSAFPHSALLRWILDRRHVLALFLIVIELALTDAIKHLLLALAIGIPLVLLYAIFRVRDDLIADKEARLSAMWRCSRRRRRRRRPISNLEIGDTAPISGRVGTARLRPCQALSNPEVGHEPCQAAKFF